jgi:hypothetical protein
MTNKRFKLRDLAVSRIAIARQGINPAAHILVAKAEDEEIAKAATAILDAITAGLKDAEVLKDTATTEDFRDILPNDTLTSLETVIKSALSATSIGEQMDIQEHIDNLPEEVVTYVADLETQVETLTKSLEEAQKPAEETPEVDPVAKAIAELPAEAQEILKSTTARLEKAEKELEATRLEKATATWVSKARAFDGAIEDPEAVGATLRDIAEYKPELAESVEKVLRTAADRIAKGVLFGELGHVSKETDTESRIAAVAKAAREANPKLSQAEAMADAWLANPDLYDQHEAERKNR